MEIGTVTIKEEHGMADPTRNNRLKIRSKFAQCPLQPIPKIKAVAVASTYSVFPGK